MKRFVSAMMFGACLLAASPVLRAQDCGNWINWDLRGTYTMSGSGFIDLSKVLPGVGLPSGPIPMFWVGAFTYNGAGGGTGWVSTNAGGGQMNAQLVGLTYSMKSDCSVQVAFSMKLTELGITIGPFHRLMVVVPKPEALELHMIFVGSGPGKPPDVGFDLGVAHRISTQY
ncbi:MAG: hypothetical protein LAQ69_36420 [Acidobacteriia bacterium]|nr:hypothetical protein [Terriglobia bacterium]